MGEAAVKHGTSYQDYLAIEAETDRKHEWLDGVVYAMAGGTLAHSALAMAIGAELRRLALERGCETFNSDAKVRVLATGLATYPDVAVVCGEILRDTQDPHAMTNPSVLVEVLSDGTEAYDRGDKFGHYREIPALCDYVLVSQHRQKVEVYSRAADGRWILSVAGPGERVLLTTLGGTIEVDRIYGGIALTARATAR